jgi:RimJ/RimL family protein N-acetyltransferase
MKLATRRLVLRDLKPGDAKSIAFNLNNLKICEKLLVVPYPYRLKDAKEYIEKCRKRAKQKKREAYNFGIEFGKSIIGLISIMDIDRFQNKAELGYWLGESYWGRGIMSEALKKILGFGFGKLKLRRIEACVFAANKASEGLLKKFGFRFEGLKRKCYRSRATKKIHDGKIYALLREEWN